MDDNPENSSELKQIRTYQGDVAEALEKQKESLYSIQERERAARNIIPEEEKKPLKRSLTLLLSGALFIVLGGAGSWLAYNEFLRKITPSEPVVPANRFINAEDSAELDIFTLSHDSFIESVSTLRSTPLKHIVLKSDIHSATISNFLKVLQIEAPGNLVRALESEFMLGSVGNKFFLIFKVKSFENAFAGMLAAEEEVVKSIGSQSVFRDVVFRNKDTRVLYDPSGKPLFLYSFLEKDYLVITEDPDTLSTIIERLTREKLTR
ncbi:MAG TPA: hypothetical protein VJJ48_00310 [Candidatus Paceibacterota bacterium]